MNLNKMADTLLYVYKTLGIFSAWVTLMALMMLGVNFIGIDLSWLFPINRVFLWMVVAWGVATWIGSIISAALIGTPTTQEEQ